MNTLPPELYVWIVSQDGEDRIRKWDIKPFEEATHICVQPSTIQSPDQGAVEAFKRVKVFADESTKQIAPFMVDLKKKLDADMSLIEQALPRPPLDLDKLRVSHTKDGSHEGWNACLDHLQAIRPDIFGGKKI